MPDVAVVMLPAAQLVVGTLQLLAQVAQNKKPDPEKFRSLADTLQNQINQLLSEIYELQMDNIQVTGQLERLKTENNHLKLQGQQNIVTERLKSELQPSKSAHGNRIYLDKKGDSYCAICWDARMRPSSLINQPSTKLNSEPYLYCQFCKLPI